MESVTDVPLSNSPPDKKKVSLRKFVYSSTGYGVLGFALFCGESGHWFISALILPGLFSVIVIQLLSGLSLWTQLIGSVVASVLFGWPVAFLIGGINVIAYGSPEGTRWFLWLLLFALPPLLILALFKAQQKILCRGLAVILALSLYPVSAAMIFDFSRAEYTPGNDERDSVGRIACLGPRVKQCGFLVSDYFDKYDGSEWVWKVYAPFVDMWFNHFDNRYYHRSYPNGVPRRID